MNKIPTPATSLLSTLAGEIVQFIIEIIVKFHYNGIFIIQLSPQ